MTACSVAGAAIFFSSLVINVYIRDTGAQQITIYCNTNGTFHWFLQHSGFVKNVKPPQEVSTKRRMFERNVPLLLREIGGQRESTSVPVFPFVNRQASMYQTQRHNSFTASSFSREQRGWQLRRFILNYVCS